MCPPNVSAAQCTIILTRVTALETLRDGIAYPTKVTKAGRIVAFTVGPLAAVDQQDDAEALHPLPRHDVRRDHSARVTVLKPVAAARRRQLPLAGGRRAATSSTWSPYLGSVVQIPLETTHRGQARRGDRADHADLGPGADDQRQTSKKFAYRQSRSANCISPPATSQAQLTSSQTPDYKCDYSGHAGRVLGDRGHLPERDQPGSVRSSDSQGRQRARDESARVGMGWSAG